MMSTRPPLIFAACAASLLLVGCGKHLESSAPVGTLGLLFTGTQATLPTSEALNSFPYAAQFVRMGDGPKGMVVLGGVKQNQLSWVSQDRVILVTRYGRIIKLANWPVEIVGWRCQVEDPLPSMNRTQHARFEYEIDLMPAHLSRIPVQAELERLGAEDIQVGDRTEVGIHVVEHLRAAALDYEASNHYWLHPQTGRVLKSIQAPAPGIAPILIEAVRPYAS
ncbi:MAG: YjbF family lipoprotein [Pseudomonadota bacterium]